MGESNPLLQQLFAISKPQQQRLEWLITKRRSEAQHG
jgi:hypothetical protein